MSLKFLTQKTFGIENWILIGGGILGALYLMNPSQPFSVNASQLINSDPARTTSTGNPRQSWSSPVPVPQGLANNFVGGNTATSGPIGNTGLAHGPATSVPYPCAIGTALDGKKVQNGYCIASLTWNQSMFCGATSLQNAKDKASLAIARYIAGKLKHPTNFYETPQFIAAVQQAYPTYIAAIAANMFPVCRFKPWGAGQVPSDHTQNDGIFDPAKQIADDMLHYGCLGGPGIAEYGTEALTGDPTDCAGESAVPPTSPYHTS